MEPKIRNEYLNVIRDVGGQLVNHAKSRRQDQITEYERQKQAEIEASNDKPVMPPAEWLNSEYHCGSFANTTFLKIREIFLDVVENNIFEIVLGGSIGWGKTTFTMLLHLWSLYLLSRKSDPHASYRAMNKTAAIASMVFNTTAEKAKKAYWVQFFDTVWSIPYFRNDFIPERRTRNSLRFPHNMIHSFSGASETAAESENLIFLAMDEVNLYDSVEKSARAEGGLYDEAQEIYSSVRRRMESRFMLPDGYMPEPSFLVMLCKETYPDSFIRTHIAKLRADNADQDVVLDDGTVRRRYAAIYEFSEWETKPEVYGTDCEPFWIKTATRMTGPVIITDRKIYEDEKNKLDTMIASGASSEDSGRMIEVPNPMPASTHLRTARENLDKFIRDVVGLPTSAIGPFFRNREHIYRAVRKKNDIFPWIDVSTETITDDDLIPAEVCRHPYTSLAVDFQAGAQMVRDRIALITDVITSDGESYERWQPFVNPCAERYIHVDMGLTNDAAGVCICHVAGYVKRSKISYDSSDNGQIVDFELPFFWVDLCLCVTPPADGGQIRFSDIRQIVKDYQKCGYIFRAGSADGFQSANLLQDFADYGMESHLTSVDRTIEPYSMLRDIYNDGRISVYPNDLYETEICSLERGTKTSVRSGKRTRIEWVDHPIKGTKDIADAVAGAIYTATSYAPTRRVHMMPEAVKKIRGDNKDGHASKTDRGFVDGRMCNIFDER